MAETLSVTEELKAQIAAGELDHDPIQIEAAKALDALLERLIGYTGKRGLFSRRIDAPQGLYMWGGVGRGKSMLMDRFYDRVAQTRKSRVHFHAFMLDIHARMNAWRKMSERERRASDYYVRGAGDDPVPPVAEAVAQEALILCFDEFHVTDIADAMILSRLFTALWERGVVVLATSNRAPEALYKHGLNRGLFEPFIALIPEHMVVHEFDGETDHRLRQLEAAPVYYTPLGTEADAGLEAAWKRLVGPAKARETVLNVQGRSLRLSKTAAGTAWVEFDRLCGQPLGAADYLRLSHAFQTVILENVPKMGPEMRNEATRFVTLVDALYETRTKLIMSAEVPPEQLYTSGTGAFEFERTVSRLIEMRSHDYLGARRSMGAGEE